MVELNWKAISVPKRGNSVDENEDAFAPGWKKQFVKRSKSARFAISDGATQAAFSGLWAQILVDQIYHSRYQPSRGRLLDITSHASHLWVNELAGRDLPWFAEEKVRKGAFATLLWLSIMANGNEPGGSWKALAIGDSNLFQVRKDTLVEAFPIQESTGFHNNPILLSSHLIKNHQVWEQVRIKASTWMAGDDFFLMTDALAAWFLKQWENGEKSNTKIQQWFINVDGDGGVADNIQLLRDRGELKNDDTTLIWIDLLGKTDQS